LDISEAIVQWRNPETFRLSPCSQQTIVGFDVMRAELAAKHREAVLERIEGADHALDLPNEKVPEGLEAVFGRVEDWFLRDAAGGSPF
jgi:hypothetical protein